eukprot:6200145-Pleurochrysis_carterae.AAC.3
MRSPSSGHALFGGEDGQLFELCAERRDWQQLSLEQAALEPLAEGDGHSQLLSTASQGPGRLGARQGNH